MAGTDAADRTLVLPQCDGRALHALRRWLRARLTDARRADDAELVATELVTNAIDHGAGAAAVRVTVDDDAVRIEVDDRNPSVALTVGRSRLGRHRGHGLAIVDSLASWGVRPNAAGKTVWAVV